MVPIAKPRILIRPSSVPIAMASSKKISGALVMIHLTVSMVDFPAALRRFDLRPAAMA
ncbi:hypothetical protein ACVWWG_001344 [Bradyrhizobium sp. LB7.2]